VLDLRFNNGGELGLNSWVLKSIQSLSKGKPFYVIIGPRTFSAGMNLVVDLEWLTDAIFLGEPTGSSPVHLGQDNFTFLANSRLLIGAASRRFQGLMSDDHRKWIAPDVYIPLTFQDMLEHKDPVLEEILSYSMKKNGDISAE